MAVQVITITAIAHVSVLFFVMLILVEARFISQREMYAVAGIPSQLLPEVFSSPLLMISTFRCCVVYVKED